MGVVLGFMKGLQNRAIVQTKNKEVSVSPLSNCFMIWSLGSCFNGLGLTVASNCHSYFLNHSNSQS